MKKLIFINRYFYPDHSATSQMLTDLAFGLAYEANIDKEIHIVTSRQRYGEAGANLPVYERVNNVCIHRIWTSRFGRQNLIGRAIDYLSFYFFSALKLFILARKGDVLVAKTDPPMISLVVGFIARIKGAELINWLQDLFPEVAAELGIKLMRGAPYRWLKKLRNKTLQQARMNIAIGELMAQRLNEEGIPKSKITEIHNWADGDLIRPVPHSENPLRKEWGLEGKFVVGYSGNLGRSHEFSTILSVAESLQDRNDLCFLFIGGGAQLPQIKQQCAEKGLTNVMFKPYQPRDKLDQSLSAADVHLVSLKPELEGLIVPSKFYGVLAAGRPIIFIGKTNGELATIIENENCGQIVKQDAPAQMIEVITKQMEHGNSDKQSKQIRKLFDEEFSKASTVNKFKVILK